MSTKSRSSNDQSPGNETKALKTPSPEFRVPSPEVHVSYALPRGGLPASTSFRRWVAAALAEARRTRETEVCIRVVGAAEGRQLNRDYRGKDHATNVLSFPVELPAGVAVPLIGDLVICAPVVAREAAEQHKRARDHWTHLTVHGVLHLLGWDHIVEAQAERMENLERQVMATLGLSDPYA